MSILRSFRAPSILLSAITFYSLTTAYSAAVVVTPSVTVTIETNVTTLNEGDTASIVITRNTLPGATDAEIVAALGAPLPVTVNITGTASNGNDYAFITSPITIPAGASAVVVPFNSTADNLIEAKSGETATFTIGDSPSYTVTAGKGAITERIFDVDTRPVISITQTEDLIDENDSLPIVFTVNRTGATDNALTIPLIISGSATNGVDYLQIPSTVTIPQGDSSVDINITPINDNEIEGTINEDVQVDIEANPTYYTVLQGRARLEIRDDDTLPEVLLVKNGNSQTEGSNANFTVYRTGSTQNALPVYFTLSGTATLGDDYVPPASFVTIPAGSESVDLNIQTIDDDKIESNETITITLKPSINAPQYLISSGYSTATQSILDNDNGPTISVDVIDPSAVDPGNDYGVIRFTRTGPTTSPITIKYEISGNALNGIDYVKLSGHVVIKARQSSIDVVIKPKKNNRRIVRATFTPVATANYDVDGSEATVRIRHKNKVGF